MCFCTSGDLADPVHVRVAVHGQPGHTAQISRCTLSDVVVVAGKVLVCQLRLKKNNNNHKKTHRKYTQLLKLKVCHCCRSSWLPPVATHGEPVAPLPAAIVHGVPPVQPDPEPVLLVL